MSGALRVFSDNPMWATSVLVSISVIAFFGEIIVAMATLRPTPQPFDFLLRMMDGEIMYRFGAIPSGAFPDWYRLIAACYLHYNGLHIFFNMAALADFGRVLEPQLKGPRLIVAYFVTGVIGFAVSSYWYLDQFGGQTAGASGAVFGVQGLLLGQMLARKDPRFRDFLFRTIGYSVVYWYLLRTNNAAHMGGLFAGIIMGYAFGKESRPWQRDAWLWGGAIVSLLLSVAALLIAQWTYMHPMLHTQ